MTDQNRNPEPEGTEHTGSEADAHRQGSEWPSKSGTTQQGGLGSTAGQGGQGQTYGQGQGTGQGMGHEGQGMGHGGPSHESDDDEAEGAERTGQEQGTGSPR